MKEESIQIQVCTYLKYQYPDLIWVCDYAAGIRLNIGQAVKAKKLRSCRGLPDIMIFAANDKLLWHGLFLELKTVTPYKKNGELKAGDHLKEQFEVITRLKKAGYLAMFIVGFDEAKNVIDNYLRKK